MAKIRYKGKLYDTEAKCREVKLEEEVNHGYWGDVNSFIADDGEKICFKLSKFSNFDHQAWVDSWTTEERMFGSIENKRGVIIVEEDIAIPKF